MNDTQTQRGILLPCRHCGEVDARILLDLADETLTCSECDTEFSAESIRSFIARWTPVLKWLDAFPRSSSAE